MHKQYRAPSDWERSTYYTNRKLKPEDTKLAEQCESAASYKYFGETAPNESTTGLTEVFNRIDFNKVPGKNPIEKGVNLAKLIKKVGPPQDNGSSVDKAVKSLSELMEGMEEMEKLGGLKGGTGTDKKGPVIDDIEKLRPDQIAFLRALSRISKMKGMTGGKSITRVIDAPGNITGKRQVKNMYEAFNALPMHEKVNPGKYPKILRKEGEVRKQLTLEPIRQISVILIDDSGSMHSDNKLAYVKAVLAANLRNMMEEQSEVYVARFETKMYDLQKMIDIAFFKKFIDEYAIGDGGTTYLNRIIPPLQKDLMKGELSDGKIRFQLSSKRVEVLIVNDGQDDIGNFTPLLPFHALTLYEENEELEELCLRSKGSYRSIS